MAKKSKGPDESGEPKRGEAAWRAAKEGVAARNERAYARGRVERDEREARSRERRRQAERADVIPIAKQPTRS